MKRDAILHQIKFSPIKFSPTSTIKFSPTKRNYTPTYEFQESSSQSKIWTNITVPQDSFCSTIFLAYKLARVLIFLQITCRSFHFHHIFLKQICKSTCKSETSLNSFYRMQAYCMSLLAEVLQNAAILHAKKPLLASTPHTFCSIACCSMQKILYLQERLVRLFQEKFAA